MKNQAKLKNLSAYQDYTIDLTTEQATSNNNVYLIDKRLLDELLSKVVNGSLEDIKQDLHNQVSIAHNKENLFERLDNYIYLDKIVQMVNPVIDGPTLGEAIDMIANGKDLRNVKDYNDHPKRQSSALIANRKIDMNE